MDINIHICGEQVKNLTDAILALAHELCASRTDGKNESGDCKPLHRLECKLDDLHKLGEQIMATVVEWAAKVGPKLDRVQTGLDAVQALVEKFQNSPGALTPEDQALLDQIEAKIDAIATDADSVPATPPA